VQLLFRIIIPYLSLPKL